MRKVFQVKYKRSQLTLEKRRDRIMRVPVPTFIHGDMLSHIALAMRCDIFVPL